MPILHEENFLWLEWSVVLQVLQRESWGWRESHKIGKLFECHLEDLKPDVTGEFVLFCFSGSVFPRMTLTSHVLDLVIF